MIRPAGRALFVALLGLTPALLFLFGWVATTTPWQLFWLAVALLFVFEAMRLPWKRHLDLKVSVPKSVYLGEALPVTFEIENVRSRRIRVAPMKFEFEWEFSKGLLDVPRQSAVLEDGQYATQIDVFSPRRGPRRIEALWLRWYSPWSFWSRVTRVRLDREVVVLVNLALIKAQSLQLPQLKSLREGLKVTRGLGEGSEFDRLREFTQGMDSRNIDWRSSARHQRLMAREYRIERNHHIVVAVDCGHLMAKEIDGKTRLDHAIHSLLLLAYGSLKNGDRVSTFGFSDRVLGFAEAQSGVAALPRIQERMGAYEYGHSETNYTLALAYLGQKLRRRSLIVVVTEFVDSVSAEIMIENIGRLARKHLILFVTIRERHLAELQSVLPESLLDVGRAIVARELEREREVVLKRLERLGVMCLDCAPGELSGELIDHYLTIKRRERI